MKPTKQEGAELRNLLEDIAKELAPQYEGKLHLGKYSPSIEPFIPGDHEHQYIVEVTKDRFLGLIPCSKKREILRINEFYYGKFYGLKDISVCLLDNRAEKILMKHLVPYAKERGVTNIKLQKGYTESITTLTEFLTKGHPEQESKTVVHTISQ